MSCVSDSPSGSEAGLYVSRPSPLKKFVLVICSKYAGDEAYIIDTVHNRVVSRDVVPKHWSIIKWVSWSPNERFALVVAAGEMTNGDMAFVDLQTGNVEEIHFKNFTNNPRINQSIVDEVQDFEPAGISWISGNAFNLQLNVHCDPYENGDESCITKILRSYPASVKLSPFSVSYGNIVQARTTRARRISTRDSKQVKTKRAISPRSAPAPVDVRITRLIRTLKLSSSFTDVWAGAISPDGKIIALGNMYSDKAVKLYDAQTGMLRHRLIGHTADVMSLAFSPDSKMLVTGSHEFIRIKELRGEARIWDVQTGELLHVLKASSDAFSVAFSPDGKTVATGTMSFDEPSQVRLWDAQSGQLLRALTGRGQYVTYVAFSPDNEFVVGGCNDGTLNIWNIQTGELWHTLTDAGDGFITFSPDGRLMASTGSIAGGGIGIRLWDIQTGKLLRI